MAHEADTDLSHPDRHFRFRPLRRIRADTGHADPLYRQSDGVAHRRTLRADWSTVQILFPTLLAGFICAMLVATKTRTCFRSATSRRAALVLRSRPSGSPPERRASRLPPSAFRRPGLSAMSACWRRIWRGFYAAIPCARSCPFRCWWACTSSRARRYCCPARHCAGGTARRLRHCADRRPLSHLIRPEYAHMSHPNRQLHFNSCIDHLDLAWRIAGDMPVPSFRYAPA